ncbi:MBL fold metallo-hydrolase [Clostridium botulinum C/D]|nr:metallo beta-lactamase family protein [Clostridium botulinum BKT015925]KEH96039.1 metallo beta-lactamase family protein [Clostridium botulinum C/D str. Sp77]MCD3198090.1 MBL fold metallo-hydrolase [Clostridium botulinum C/D]NFF30729.1 MBL fold metallo-hydrolase [Clostridium botulinum]MCD3211769.1 MBL fold metallo-hydrolase [Clostridium botulinum C/D]
MLFLVVALYGCRKNKPTAPTPAKITKNSVETQEQQNSSKFDEKQKTENQNLEKQNLEKSISVIKDVKEVQGNVAGIKSDIKTSIKSVGSKSAITKGKINVVKNVSNSLNSYNNSSTTKVKETIGVNTHSNQQVKPQTKPNTKPNTKPQEVKPQDKPQTEIKPEVVENDKNNSTVDNDKEDNKETNTTDNKNDASTDNADNTNNTGNTDDTSNTDNNNNDLGILKVHYIDVGQADSILVQQDGHNMLIDAGNNEDDKLVVDYLKKQGVKKLDYVIGTHPHEDHIGGLDKVIDNFDVDTLLMSKKIANTKTFKDVVTSAQKKNLKITEPVIGTNYNLGKATFTILAPKDKTYQGTNNYSIVQKLRFGNKSFIFTGDAEAISEMEMVNANLDLQADVLKVGHHGSKTSTCQAFLDKVNPTYAVISCGKDNKYHHPNQSTMNRLKAKGTKVYRTDESGSVVVTSDGKDIKFNCKEGSYNFRDNASTNTDDKSSTSVVKPTDKDKDKIHNEGVAQKPTVKPTEKPTIKPIKPHKPHKHNTDKKKKVYYTPNGECYHSSKKCYTLKRSKKIITGTVKKCGGRRPCSKCH